MSEILSGLGALCGCFSRPPPVEEDPWYLPKLFHELPPEEVQLMERGHLVIQVRRKKEMWLKLELVPALQRAGLHMVSFRDSTRGFIFLIVYASEARLLLEADRLKLPMELDAEQLEEQDKAMNVQLQEKGLVFLLDKDAAGCDVPVTGTAADLGIPSIQYPTLLSPFPDSLKEWIQTIFQPYEHIYAQFESPQRFPDVSPTKQARETLYKVQPATGSVLHGNDILTLLTSIIEGPVATCARLNMGKLISQGHVEAMFPGHRAQERRRLMEKWNHWAVLPWNQPFSEIRAYLGERIALYFAFLGYLSATLLVPAVLGVAVFANQVLADQPYLSWLPAFALVVITWATLLMVGWKHKQQVYGVKWGSVDVDDSTRRRPEYIESKAVHQRRSFVTGKQEYWADPLWQRVRRGTSMSIVTLAVGTVVVVIVSLFSARVLLEQEERKGNLDEGWGGYLASFLTAVQIQLCGFLYSSLAKFLTDLETHETDASYTDSLSGKRAAFELVNSNFSLFWVAFVKGNRFVIFGEEQTCTLADSGRPDCLAELQSHLAILFITRIVVNNLQELLVPMVVPYVMAFIKACTASEEEQGRGVDGLPLGEMSVMELEASKPEYDVADDWLEIVIVLSYCMFFVVAFPLAPLLTLLLIYVEQRVDMQRVLVGTRRAIPTGSKDIGAWATWLVGLSYVSVFTNTALAIFVSGREFAGVEDLATKYAIFIIVEHTVLAAKYTLETAVFGYAPYCVTLQLDRQKYLVAKHMHRVPDDINALEAVEEPDAPPDTGAAAVVPSAEGASTSRPSRGHALHHMGLSGGAMVDASDMQAAPGDGPADFVVHVPSDRDGDGDVDVADLQSAEVLAAKKADRARQLGFAVAHDHAEVYRATLGRKLRFQRHAGGVDEAETEQDSEDAGRAAGEVAEVEEAAGVGSGVEEGEGGGEEAEEAEEEGEGGGEEAEEEGEGGGEEVEEEGEGGGEEAEEDAQGESGADEEGDGKEA